MKEQIVFFVGVAVILIMVGSVTLPLLYTPTTPQLASTLGSNSTAHAISNTAPTTRQFFGLVNPDTTTTATVTINYALNGSKQAGTANVTNAAGTVLYALDGTSPDTFNLSQASLVNGQNGFNYTTNNTGSNMTSISVSYFQLPQSTTQGWSSAIVTFWNILLAIVVVAAAMLLILK